MPKRESEKWKLEPEIKSIVRFTEVNLAIVWWLNKEVDSKPTGKTRFIINDEFPVIDVLLIKGPSVQAAMDQ